MLHKLIEVYSAPEQANLLLTVQSHVDAAFATTMMKTTDEQSIGTTTSIMITELTAAIEEKDRLALKQEQELLRLTELVEEERCGLT